MLHIDVKKKLRCKCRKQNFSGKSLWSRKFERHGGKKNSGIATAMKVETGELEIEGLEFSFVFFFFCNRSLCNARKYRAISAELNKTGMFYKRLSNLEDSRSWQTRVSNGIANGGGAQRKWTWTCRNDKSMFRIAPRRSRRSGKNLIKFNRKKK